MTTPLIPQEVYLLERYSSLEYFTPIRDQWEEMVKHVEQCLDVFMETLPPDYRNRQQPHQPDIVWGERVLPNFRSTQQNLYRAYINLSHGDLNALQAAWGVTSGFRGQVEYWPDWMNEPQVTAKIPNALSTYEKLISAPQARASNITHTFGRTWSPGTLSNHYEIETRGDLDRPERWPLYRLNPSVRVEKGEVIKHSGIYLPDIDNSCAALLIEDADWDDATMLLRWEEPVSEDGTKLYKHPFPVTEWRSTGWTLIERVSDAYVDDGLADLLSNQTARPSRVAGGKPCPQTGWWYSPAQVKSRRHFKAGDIFPEIDNSDYGDTFWSWAPDQSPPSL